jgi:hypothetical protein
MRALVLFTLFATSEYPLDSIDRDVPADGIDCVAIERALVTYEGTTIRLRPPARVHPAFVHRIARFERIVDTLGREVYGRPPHAIRNGTFRCRPMKRNERRISEHALGNAIDVVAFEFAREPGAPPERRRAFSVRVDRHWDAAGEEAIHACFLRTLAKRLAGRDDVFRGMIGPSDPDHHDHLHLDMGPWRFERF